MRTVEIMPAATLEQVAEQLGISLARAAQIERAALAKLRRACARRGLALDDFLDRMQIARSDQTPYWQLR